MPRALPFLALLLATPLLAADFVDPAPPTVNKIAPADEPKPAAYPELTFHAAPKPLAAGATTEDSPGFLGPRHQPDSAETKLLADLSKLKPVWEAKKGNGYAGPAVVGDRLIFFHRVGDAETTDCLHAQTGQRFWRVGYPTTYRDRYGYTNGPRCTPAVDAGAGLVVTYGVEGVLQALDLKTGQVAWRRDLLAEFKLEPNFFGVGAAPLIEGGIVVVNVGAKNVCVVGFDLRNGKALWASPAPNKWGPSYAAVVPATVHGLRRVFVFAGGESRPATGGLLCLDPRTGVVDFALPWRGRRYESVNASAPLVFENTAFVSECYGRGGMLVDLTRDGDKLAGKVRWTNENFGTHFMTAVPVDGVLIGCDGHGPADCPLVAVDFKTGEEKWRAEPDLSEEVTTRTGEKMLRRRSTDRCHLLQVDGRTLCLTEWGHLLWLDCSAKGVKVTSRRSLFDAGETWAPPVLSRGLLYVCQNQPDRVGGTEQRILCYDLRGE
ncbi:MAG TPA: PQQ-binding-like beta-propeller repeat protein [Tepidisphaeraceae bacterium]|nr:PQQ-binding-like beta-propeller repeat protein [Tepidisphaeraceae bacterium]